MNLSVIVGLALFFVRMCIVKGWQDCETINVDQFNPNIIWWDTKRFDRLDIYDEIAGTIRVIADYRAAEGSKQFTIGVVKYEKRQDKRIKNHLISLPGGPGDSIKFVAELAVSLESIDETAIYGVEYRGFMRFAPWQRLSEPEPDLETVVNRGPFPLKDLTMENAARDVAMVIRAIQRSSEWQDGDQIILEGFSAGARWVHLVMAQYPDLVDLAYLGGIPSFGQLPLPNYDGLIEHCLLDEYCRTWMGNDLKTTFIQNLRDISNPEFNECTQIFHSQMSAYDLPKDWEKASIPRKRLLRVLRRLGYFSSFARFEETRYLTGQIGFVFVRAMHDCKDPMEFRDEIIATLRSCLFEAKDEDEEDLDGEFQITRANSSSVVDVFLNQVINVTSDYNPMTRRDLLRAKDDEEDSERISLQHGWFKYYKEWFKELRKYIKEARYFEEHPLVGIKTTVFIVASRMDTHTPPNIAKVLYDSIQTPNKFWILYDNFSHQGGYLDLASYSLLRFTLGNRPSPQDIEIFVKEANGVHKLDWTFDGHEGLKKLWNQIRPASDVFSLDVERSDFLPTFLYEKNPKDDDGMPSAPPLARCITISQHPIYVEKFGLDDEQDGEGSEDARRDIATAAEGEVGHVLFDGMEEESIEGSGSNTHATKGKRGKGSKRRRRSKAHKVDTRKKQLSEALEDDRVKRDATKREDRDGTSRPKRIWCGCLINGRA